MYERSVALWEPLSEDETSVNTQLVSGYRQVEVPGRSSQEMLDPAPEVVTLLEPRPLEDYITVLCKHECIIIKQVRHVKQTCRVLTALHLVKRALMRASSCQCGMDSAHCHADIVAEVAKLDRPGFGNHGESNEATLFCAVTLHRFGLPSAMPNWNSQLCRRYALAARLLCGIQLFGVLDRLDNFFCMAVSLGEMRWG